MFHKFGSNGEFLGYRQLLTMTGERLLEHTYGLSQTCSVDVKSHPFNNCLIINNVYETRIVQQSRRHEWALYKDGKPHRFAENFLET